MKAIVLIVDSTGQSTTINIYYSIAYFSSWESYQRALSQYTSGSASHGFSALNLSDKNGNSLTLGGFPFTAFVAAGDSGNGRVKTPSGWLEDGTLTWTILKVRRTGKWGDGKLSESEIHMPQLLDR